MTKKYTHLGLGQRYQIQAFIEAGINQKEIASRIGVSPSTISRELKRNIAKRGRTALTYFAENAQRKTNLRHQLKPKKISFSDRFKMKVMKLMVEDRWSPEFISKCSGYSGMVSHESIYKWIWHCKHTNLKINKKYKKLYQYLKHGKRKRKRGNIRDRRGIIPNRVSIEKRPKSVLARNRVGDWEIDLMMGKNHKSALLVIVDRATLHTRLKKLNSKQSDEVYKGIKQCLIRSKYSPKTITFDNDKAFTCHEKVSIYSNAKTYFTRPYTSQDKGTVENRIGVIRRFFPKKTDLTFVTDSQIKKVENKVNNRPIRKFNYKTANQALRNRIALIT